MIRMGESKANMPIKFVFDIRKAIAATAFLAQQESGKLDMFLAIKMLYIADCITESTQQAILCMSIGSKMPVIHLHHSPRTARNSRSRSSSLASFQLR